MGNVGDGIASIVHISGRVTIKINGRVTIKINADAMREQSLQRLRTSMSEHDAAVVKPC
jgi:hypothetical protein